MSSKLPIVTYRQLDAALNTKESTFPETHTAATDAADDPTEAAAMLAGLHAALETLRQADQNSGVLVSPQHKVASLLQTYLAQESANAGKVEPVPTGGREATFDEKDWLGWAKSFFVWWKRIKPHQWLNTPSNKQIPNTARLALLGDWGTGLYGAPHCARSIEKDQKGYDVLLHLGDVYYSGDKDEVLERFLALWPKPENTAWANQHNVVHRACNSNHEMYTGGHAYFNYTLAQFEQSASYFALHNDHFILAGIDTAYKEKDLQDGQVEWLADLVQGAGGRKVILFSHHQPYSWFEGGHPKITAKLGELLSNQKIFAWYWGHEHRCILYRKHPVYGLYGRCVGHSGYPSFRDKLDGATVIANGAQDTKWYRLDAKNMGPGALVLDGPNIYIPGEENKYGPNGYLTLGFDNDQLTETVHAPDGSKLYERLITEIDNA
ncbi:hypothetical protein BH18ACI2_BH18ACI2_08220 [soil metagenome]